MAAPTYQEHPPARPDHVACYWTLRADAALTHRVFPDNCTDILVSTLAEVRASFVGPMTRPHLEHVARPAEFFGIRLRPGSYLDLPGFAPRTARDAFRPFEVVDGRWLRLGGQVVSLPTLDTADAFVEWLISKGVLRRDPIVEQVLAGRGVRDLHPRTVQRHFSRSCGLTPGTMRRVARMRAALRLIRRREMPLVEVALAAGYADQSHMTHEFRRLAGLTPSELAA